MRKLTHPLGKTVPHNTKTSSVAPPASSAVDVKRTMEALRTNTKLARIGGQAATSDVGGPAFTGKI